MNFPKLPVGMLPNDRIDYSAIVNRKPLKLPHGARMAVWTITNVEEWVPTQTMPRTVLTPPAGGAPMPDIPNWCWHEYGNRVGFWRLLQVYDEFKIPGVMNINGVAVDAFPDIVKACAERKWEFVGHGYTQRNMQKVENERADIRKSAEVIAKATGKRPRGWLGPGLTETWETPDILAEEGYDYVADWVLDDQPMWLKTRGKPILNIPYTQECNDVAMMLIQHHKASEFYERAMDQFEQIHADAKGPARRSRIGFARPARRRRDARHGGCVGQVVARGTAAQSGLTPANFTTLPHFSVSSSMSLPNSAGDRKSTRLNSS